jgi:hypothetical protein
MCDYSSFKSAPVSASTLFARRFAWREIESVDVSELITVVQVDGGAAVHNEIEAVMASNLPTVSNGLASHSHSFKKVYFYTTVLYLYTVCTAVSAPQ